MPLVPLHMRLRIRTSANHKFELSRHLMRILIADDHALVRSGIRFLLESHPGFVVCGEAADGLQAVRQAIDRRPDVVLLDISMPFMNGIEAAIEINEYRPDLPILMVSMHDYAAHSRALKGVAIKGYVTKDRIGRDLISAIEAVVRGQTYFPKGGQMPC
jgi:two-component system, NarL family, nitrate/nitrite response regulator NarL